MRKFNCMVEYKRKSFHDLWIRGSDSKVGLNYPFQKKNLAIKIKNLKHCHCQFRIIGYKTCILTEGHICNQLGIK